LQQDAASPLLYLGRCSAKRHLRARAREDLAQVQAGFRAAQPGSWPAFNPRLSVAAQFAAPAPAARHRRS